MDRACDQLLADAAFTTDQHGDVAVRHLLDDGGDRLHLGAVAPEEKRAVLVVGQLPAKFRDFGDQPRLFDRVLDRRVQRDLPEPFGIVRLDDVVGGAQTNGLDNRRRLLAARQHDRLHLRLGRLQGAQRLETIHTRHHDVEQDDVRRIALFDRGQQFVAARVRARLVAAQRQEGAQIVRKGGIVIHDGDVRFPQRFNSVTGNEMIAEPRASGSGLSGSPDVLAGDQMRPPWPSMTRLASGRASPMPPRMSLKTPGSRPYASCTQPSSATISTAAEWPSRLSRRRSATTTAGPGFSRRIARKIASSADPNRAASPVINAPADGPMSLSRTSRSEASCTSSSTFSITENRSTGCCASLIAPLSSFPTSLSSAMIATSRAHDFSASSIIRRCRSLIAGSWSFWSIRRYPPTTLAGVRSSWTVSDRSGGYDRLDADTRSAYHPRVSHLCENNSAERIDHRGKCPQTLRIVRGTSIEEARRMRKRYRVLLLAALVAALVVPVGFALSLDSTAVSTDLVYSAVASPSVLPSWSMPDAAKLFIVGTVLFGLAAAVKRTS